MFLDHPARPWSVDLATMGLDPAKIDALDWNRAFAEMEALEGGAIANPDEGRAVGHYWLRAPERAATMGDARAIGETLEAVRSFAEGVRAGRLRTDQNEAFTDSLHIGIGGSALGPQLIVDALGADAGLRPHFLDNTDPDGIARVIARLGARLRSTLVTVVSKSGGTAETKNGMELVQAALRARGHVVGPRFVAITQDGSQLHQHAVAQGFRKVFPMWPWVGGRTSVCSAVGVLPAELVGIDTVALLTGARDMDEWTRTTAWRENPAAMIAGAWHAVGNGRGDRAMVVLPYSDRLLLLSRYLQQLVMESLGKRLDRQGKVVEQGLVVYGNKGSTDQHAFVQQLRDGRNDFFATFLAVTGDGDAPNDAGSRSAGDDLLGFLLGTRRALRESGRPSMVIGVPRVDAYALGGLIALFERAVGLYAALIDVNAYDQPGVEAGKRAAAEVVALAGRALAELTTAMTLEQLAAKLAADPVELWWLLQRLTATHRVVRRGTTYVRIGQ